MESASPSTLENNPPGVPRLWPAAVVVIAMTLALLTARLVWPDSLIQYVTSVAAPPAAAAAMLAWWLGFSRVGWRDRLVTPLVFVAVAGVACVAADRSLVPYGLIIYVLPLMLVLPTLWLLFTRGAFAGPRRAGTHLAIALPLLLAAAIRVDGISGTFHITVSPRWHPSAEEQYLSTLAHSHDNSTSHTAAMDGRLAAGPGDWPGFRGPRRDGVARDVRIQNPWPEEGLPEVWRRQVGPGWSSFAVVDDRLFTQEQRGEEEAIMCLDAATGEELWAYTYPGRFYEMAGNAGPRATPTFDNGRLYAFGATGKLTALDAASGRLHWQTDVAADSGAEIPTWGFSASPLVVDGRTVVVLAGDPGDKTIAYDAETGKVKWSALDEGVGYSSPQLMTLGGEPQIVVMDSEGTFGIAPHTGEVLWKDSWPLTLGGRIVQPLQIDDNSIVIGTGYGVGTRRLKISQTEGTWNVEEQWISRHLKPYFNDFVYHEGYLYGFDDQIITCIDAETGRRQWKKGRYGFGQMLLIPEQDLLLITGEKGQLALLRATPEKSEAGEIAQFRALEGKTWNHPVIVGSRLYVRNSQVAVCYEIGETPSP